MVYEDFIIFPLYIIVSYIIAVTIFVFSYILLFALNIKNETILSAHRA